MVVSLLPPNAGPVISLDPPLLSFTTLDGSSTPTTQIVSLSNPGQQELHWSLAGGQTIPTTLQSSFRSPQKGARNELASYTLADNGPAWLQADITSGSLAPGKSVQVHLTVRSQSLLPGSYMETLNFSAAAGSLAYDNPEPMAVALTVEPHCGLITSAGNVDFTAVVGQSNPSNHTLSLNATSSCANGTLNWQALPSTGWITVNPASGEVKGTNSSVTAIGVNTTGLAPGHYMGLVTLRAEKSTQTVIVYLDLQPAPPPSEPIMGVSPLSLNFSTISGQATPTGQAVTITNNGGSALQWHSNITLLTTSWLSVSPGGGMVAPGETGQLTVNISTSGLTPGSYTGQLTLSGTDMRGSHASGSPQVITVSLVVQPPCTLAQPSQSSLVFSAIAGGASPLAQTINLTGTGSCTWPLHWSTSVSPAAPWLSLTPTSGQLTTASQQGSMAVGVSTAGLQPGTYTTQVKISAVDAAGTQAQGSPQTFSITLTVLQPCTLQSLPAQLVLSAAQGQDLPTSQTFTLNETGSCAGGVAWTATGSSGTTWLSITPGSGTDKTGGSTITVTASASGLTPGSYSSQVTVSASNNGVVLQGSPQTITVTFQVTGYTVSGSAVTCEGPSPTCTTPAALPGAAVSLVDGNGKTIATTTADASGNFSFAGIAKGSYTIQASGTVGTTTYTGSANVTVSGNATGVTVQTFSS
jgi:hypothetical protein